LLAAYGDIGRATRSSDLGRTGFAAYDDDATTTCVTPAARAARAASRTETVPVALA